MSIQQQINDIDQAIKILILKKRAVPKESPVHRGAISGMNIAIDKLQSASWQLRHCENVLKGMDLETPIQEELKDIKDYEQRNSQRT